MPRITNFLAIANVISLLVFLILGASPIYVALFGNLLVLVVAQSAELSQLRKRTKALEEDIQGIQNSSFEKLATSTLPTEN